MRISFVLLVFWLGVATTRHVRDQRLLRKVVQDNTGIIEWIVEHIEEAIRELEKESTISNYECLVGMAYVVQDVAKGKFWAIGMIDSSAKIPDGILQANFNDLGVYDQCVAIVNPNPEMPFTGMHCLVDFKITVPADMTFEVDGSTLSITTLLGSNVVTLTLGHCYPSVCKPSTIQDAYNLLAGRVGSMTNGSYNLEIAIDPTDCHLADRDVLQTSDWLVLMVIAMILFTAALSTTLDIAYFRHELKDRRATMGEQAALSFSVFTNGKKLLNLQQGADSINCLNGLKFFSIGWVVLGHRYRYIAQEPVDNLIKMAPALKQWSKMVIFSAPLSVDTFFMISGLLNMYQFMRTRSKKRSYSPVETIVSYIHRFVRITPSYAMAIAFTSTLLYRMGDGPEWDRMIRPVQNDCKTGWWYNILYINNIGIDNYCMLQSWYLSADMQMFWAAPLLMYPLWRWPIVGYVETFLLLGASVAAPLLVSLHFEIPAPIPVTADGDRKDLIMRVLYLPTWTKFTSYVVGIFLGYLLFKIRDGKIDFKMNKVTNMVLWLGTAGIMLFAVFGGFPCFQLDYDYEKNKFYSAFYIGFYRLFWGIGLFWIILACDNGWGGPVNGILSWEIFGPLGKLTYCIYLIHVGVMLVGVASVRHTIYYSDYFEVHSFLGDMVLCVVVAAAFSLLFEAPLMTLEKLVLSPSKPKKRVVPVNMSSDTEAIIPSAPTENDSVLLKRHVRADTTQL
uniref:Nose resistant to fluoxetine protein 6 n=2 Tax=Lygus hesperus TaxID=30085 RepID=A0A0A9W997_LYGHE